jgi:hypothetical protein
MCVIALSRLRDTGILSSLQEDVMNNTHNNSSRKEGA